MGLPRSTYYDAPVATADEAEIVARIEADLPQPCQGRHG